jgi:hypothetical protein
MPSAEKPKMEKSSTYRSSAGDTVHVYSVDKPDYWGLLRVVVPSFCKLEENYKNSKEMIKLTNPKRVHPVLKRSPRRPDDHPSPSPQVNIILVLQAPTDKNSKLFKLPREYILTPPDGSIPHPFLSSL